MQKNVLPAEALCQGMALCNRSLFALILSKLVHWFLTKTARLMQLTAIFLTVCSFTVAASSVSQSITFSGKEVTLEKVFSAIESQTGYYVLYEAGLLQNAQPVSIKVTNMPLTEFMEKILAKQLLTYSLLNTTITIEKKIAPVIADLNSLVDVLKNPFIDVEGRVFEESSKTPLSGVSIVNKRTGKGTQSDASGKFVLKEVMEGDQISYSMIGYQSITIPAAKSNLIMLKVAVDELDKTVIQAYGTTSRRLATGDITRISGEEIARHPVMNPLLALQGRVPGMIVTPSSGRASSPVKIVLMGRNSVNKDFSPEPLYIIDGVPQTILDLSTNTKYAANEGASPGYVQGGFSNTQGQSPLFGIDPKEIESIEVLKDGDATAIYGSRGANGVILITTKKAKAGKTSFSLSYDKGISDASRKAKLFNTQDYLKYRREALYNDGITPTRENAPDLMVYDTTRYTDWQDVLYRSGKTTALRGAISGGDMRNTFRLSAGYNSSTPITMGKGKDEVIGLDLSTSHSSADQKFRISAGVNYTYTYVDAVELGGSPMLPPNAPAIFDSLGRMNYVEWVPSAGLGNYPFTRYHQPNIIKTNILSSNILINYKVRNDLTLEVRGGYNTARNTNDNFSTISSQDPRVPANAFAVFSNTNTSTLIIEPGIRYSRFVSKGKLEAMAGTSYQSSTTSNITTIGIGYTNDNLMGTVTNATAQQISDGYGLYKYTALFGRINYNWENKYIINLNGRRDGSSRFAPGRQFGNFGSVGLSWNMSEEKWLRKALPSWVSFLKLRGSYGITGRDGIGDYQYMARWGSSLRQGAPLLPYNEVRPYTLLQPVNQIYHWEGTKMLSGGLEMSLLDNNINLAATIQRNVADDQLTRYPTPMYSGFPSVVANSPAEIMNVTYGLSISGTLISNKNFQWQASFNIGTTKNKLLAYPNLEFSPHASLYRIGESLSTEFVLRYLGVDPLSGEYRFKDYNGDGGVTLDASPRGKMTDDRYIAINMDPKYDGGFNTSLSYKGVSLSTGFAFRRGWMKTSFLGSLPGPMVNVFVPSEGFDDHWRRPGDVAKYGRISTIRTNHINNSDGGMMDVTLLRMGNIALSYALKNELVRKAGMAGCSIGFSASNLFTLTRFAGVDPLLLSGVPTPRTFNGSIAITF